MPTKRTTAPANDAEAYELRLHVDNTSRFYFQRRAVEDSLLRKVKAGKYNHALATKAFLYVVDAAARDYRKENRMVGGFSPATRMMVAKDLVDGFEGEFDVKVANPSRKRKTAKRNPSRGMTKEQAIREFRSLYPAGSFRGHSGRLDKPMAREAWNNFTDSLHRDRRITDNQVNRWGGLPQYR
jgi:hypothetical protein